MTDHAVIDAQCVDYQNDRMHKGSIKITLHIPVERGAELARILGTWPTYMNPIPVALARLREHPQPAQEDPLLTTAQPAPVTPNRPARASLNKLTQLAGILSGDKQFHAYARQRWPFIWKHLPDVDDKERAAEVIRQNCQAASRRDLVPGTPQGDAFLSLYDSFAVWRDAPVHGIEA